MKNIFTKKALIPVFALVILLGTSSVALAKIKITYGTSGDCTLTDAEGTEYHGKTIEVLLEGGRAKRACLIDGEAYTASAAILPDGGAGNGDGILKISKYLNSVFPGSMELPTVAR